MDEPGKRDEPGLSPEVPLLWNDLRLRTLSGASIAGVSLILLVAGGRWFQMLGVFVAAVMIWEMWMMIRPQRPDFGLLLTALAASVLSVVISQHDAISLGLLLVAPGLGAALAGRERLTFFLFALGIEVACWGLVEFRALYGLPWVIWLILVVVGTDIAGYFSGKTFGGPKFWPAVSPKKTWSGTVGGWVCALLIGAFFMIFHGAGASILIFSVALSFASQMGDIAESALKRRMKVKDSSNLIPGHGGLFDRFDGLLGGSLFMLLVTIGLNLPGASF